eukprot:10485389-Alexandrium_andersonii.AAC.1
MWEGPLQDFGDTLDMEWQHAALGGAALWNAHAEGFVEFFSRRIRRDRARRLHELSSWDVKGPPSSSGSV